MSSVSRAITSALTTAVVAATVALGAFSTAATAEPGSGGAAGGDPARDRARALLDRVDAIFAGNGASLLARRDGASALGNAPDLTLLLRDLRQSLPDLSPAERRTANRYLARPTDPGGDQLCSDSACQIYLGGLGSNVETWESAHFVVHYQTTPPLTGYDNTASLAQAKKSASILEHVFNQETGKLGFRKPRTDGNQDNVGSATNPDGRFDVYLADTGRIGVYGYVTSDAQSGAKVPAYLVLDNDFARGQFRADPTESLKVTAAHEFFHAIQYAYDANELAWFMEGTAVWAEEAVYPKINDYLQYIRSGSAINRPQVPIDSSAGLHWYASVLFWKFLDQYLHDRDVIRQIWVRAEAGKGRNGLKAVVSELKQRKRSFKATFARFGVWNTKPPAKSNQRYHDTRYFPKYNWWRTRNMSMTRRGTGAQPIRLDHLTNAGMRVYPKGALPPKSELLLHVRGPKPKYGSYAVAQIRYKSGRMKLMRLPINKRGVALRRVPFNINKMRYVAVTVANASTRGLNNQRFYVQASLRLPGQ